VLREGDEADVPSFARLAAEAAKLNAELGDPTRRC
jgi:hypothetical protein